MANIINGTLTAGQTSVTINTSGTAIQSILVTDASTHECVLSDIVINTSTVVVSVAEAYDNNLNIVIVEV